MKTAAVIFFFLILVASPRPVFSQNGFKVSGITIAGNRTFSENVILQQMETKRVNWFSEHILQKDPFLFNPEILKSDLESIRTFYQREGYLFVQLSPPEVEINQKTGTAALMIRIEEHAPVMVKEVVLSQPDLQRVSRHERDSLLARVGPGLLLKTETVFRDAHLNADRKTLLMSLANGGYPFATANYTLAVDTVDTLVSLRWMITPGHSAVFDTVSISGNDKVALEMILDKITFKNGERYDAGKLAASQLAIYNLGLFNAVTIRANLEDTTASAVPVNVVLKEALQVKVLMGASYGKEEEFRLTAEIRLLDVIGDADRLTLELKRSALQPYEVKITYIQTDFLFDDMTLSLIPTVRSETESDYSMKRIWSTISLDNPLFKNLRGSIGYGQENVDLDTASIASTNPPQQILETYAKNSVHMALLSSNAAPLFDPVRGMSASLQFTLSGVTEDNPYRFSRVLFDLKRYDRLRENTILAAPMTKSIKAYNLYLEALSYGFNTGPTQIENLHKRIRVLQEALAIDPNFANAYWLLSATYTTSYFHEIHGETKNPHEMIKLAKEATDRALELNPRLAEVYESRGIIFWMTGQPIECIENLKKVTELAPGLSSAWYIMGQQYHCCGLLKEAENCFRRAAELNPLNTITRWWHAQVVFYQGRETEAENELRCLVSQYPDAVLMKSFLGEVLFYQGKIDEAEPLLAHAAAIWWAAEGPNPGWYDPAYFAGYLYASQDRREKIDTRLFKLTTVDVNDGNLAYHMAGIYALLNEKIVHGIGFTGQSTWVTTITPGTHATRT